VRPNGSTRIGELEQAGGTLAVLKRLEGLAHLDAQNVSGEFWRAILARAEGTGAVFAQCR